MFKHGLNLGELDNSKKSVRIYCLYSIPMFRNFGWFEIILFVVALVLVATGFFTLFKFIAIISDAGYSIGSENISFEVTGQVGDFIGGVIGSIWALSGVILFFLAIRLQSNELAEQRRELELQRVELSNQRQEFTSNRILNIIYNESSKMDKKLSAFSFRDPYNLEPKIQDWQNGLMAIELFSKSLNRIKEGLDHWNYDKIEQLLNGPITETVDILRLEFNKSILESGLQTFAFCYKLINEKKDGIFVLDEFIRDQLQKLVTFNFNLDKIIPFYDNVREFKEILKDHGRDNLNILHYDKYLDLLNEIKENLKFSE